MIDIRLNNHISQHWCKHNLLVALVWKPVLSILEANFGMKQTNAPDKKKKEEFYASGGCREISWHHIGHTMHTNASEHSF